MKVGALTILISDCTAGIYLRWWFNGWHYFNFQNGYEMVMASESMGTQVTRMFSRISKIERPTKLKAEYSYRVTLEGITAGNIPGFTGLLLAEKVEQYEGTTWYEVEITRGDHLIKNADTNSYIFNFEITRKELPNASTVMQKSILLYLDDTLCDLDDDEIIPINKQVNDIAEMQDRQSDYTQQFKIRKTRAMKSLFELSGEVGANTSFPYEKQTCRLVIDAVEVFTEGEMVLDNVDEDYYYVSIYSGNSNFFKEIDGLKITDLTLASADHTWNIVDMEASQVGDLDYLYPLLEPSDDGGLSQLITTDDLVSIWGGHIWPFVKVKAIWDEIFNNAGYTDSGDILTDDKFLALFMPIASLDIPKSHSNKYLYSVYWWGNHSAINNEVIAFTGATLINGDENFRLGYYYLPFSGTYKIIVRTHTEFGFLPTLGVYLNAAYQGDMTLTDTDLLRGQTWEFEVTGTAAQYVSILTSAILYYYYSVAITEITDPVLAYGSVVTPAVNLPDLSQTEFIKMICNQFGLVPDAKPRDRKINFWNYDELYDNMPIARNWEKYLSETDDVVTFKFGDYAQRNYLRYKDSDDVLLDQGVGIMQIDDTTLPDDKEVIQIPLSTCDEVTILVDVVVSRIDMNKWDEKTSLYVSNDSIDPRIVFISTVDYSAASPFYEKTLRLRSHYNPAIGTSADIVTPRKASSLEISFSNLVVNYASLSRMLTRTNLRRSKFNLPVFEVAGLRYNIPIYLPQYKAYFYVNKISNYVNGQLCTVPLIKL